MAERNEIRHLLIATRRLLRSVLNITDGADVESTIEGIKRDIGFRGPTAWILISSILIASIGLNINSTAVIIGAMLISPLMGPILGIGLSVGTNDFETLTRSLKNFGVAVAIGLITSTLYFMLTPLNIEQSELLARTKPTILDVLVAFFGGFAGIVAGSRKEKTNVIPGVAIATALMPPLCTAGYGLATFKLHFFFGAFYLFFINSVFISLATYIVVKYLKFPLITYINPMKEKRYKSILLIFLIITIIPSTIIFYSVMQEARFAIASDHFVKENCNFEGSQLINKKITFSDTLSTIELYYLGNEISEEKKRQLSSLISRYGLVGSKFFPITKRVEVRVHQEKDNDVDFEKQLVDLNNNLRMKILEDIYARNEEIAKDKDQKIALLEKELLRIKSTDTIPLRQISKEITFLFKSVNEFGFANLKQIRSVKDSIVFDTIPTFAINYNSTISTKNKSAENEKIRKWLQLRFDNPKINVFDY